MLVPFTGNNSHDANSESIGLVNCNIWQNQNSHVHLQMYTLDAQMTACQEEMHKPQPINMGQRGSEPFLCK